MSFSVTGKNGEFLLIETDPVTKTYIRHSDIVSIRTDKDRGERPYKVTVNLNGGHGLKFHCLTLDASAELCEFLANHITPKEKTESVQRALEY